MAAPAAIGGGNSKSHFSNSLSESAVPSNETSWHFGPKCSESAANWARNWSTEFKENGWKGREEGALALDLQRNFDVLLGVVQGKRAKRTGGWPIKFGEKADENEEKDGHHQGSQAAHGISQGHQSLAVDEGGDLLGDEGGHGERLKVHWENC
jgi:hypothetical protein